MAQETTTDRARPLPGAFPLPAVPARAAPGEPDGFAPSVSGPAPGPRPAAVGRNPAGNGPRALRARPPRRRRQLLSLTRSTR